MPIIVSSKKNKEENQEETKVKRKYNKKIDSTKYSDIESLRKAYLEQIITKISEKTAIFKMSDVKVPTKMSKVLSTGIPSFDIICARTPKGRSGLPVGRQIELFGHESSGKTSFACYVVGQIQKRYGWNAVWLEHENKFDTVWAKKLGVDIDNALITQPDCFEDTIDYIDSIMDSMPEKKDLTEENKNFGTIIVVDSVASIPTREELAPSKIKRDKDGNIQSSIDRQFIGLFARKMSQAQRRLTNRLSKRNMIIIWINQNRDKIQMGFGKRPGGGVTTPGGKALKFYCAQRWSMNSWSTSNERKKGLIRITIKNEKNNSCNVRPYHKVDLFFNFENGFDYIESWIDAMNNLHMVSRRANTITMNCGEASGSKFTIHKLKEMYEENPVWFYEYEELMKDHINSYSEEKGDMSNESENSEDSETEN